MKPHGKEPNPVQLELGLLRVEAKADRVSRTEALTQSLSNSPT